MGDYKTAQLEENKGNKEKAELLYNQCLVYLLGKKQYIEAAQITLKHFGSEKSDSIIQEGITVYQKDRAFGRLAQLQEL